MIGSNSQKEYGDYQTPAWFADKVCQYLADNLELNPSTIIEPTCGLGSFIQSCLTHFPQAEIKAIEINPEYISKAKTDINSPKVTFYTSDFFKFDFAKLRNRKSINKQTLIVGNPPWVTNSALSALGSNNTPEKSNIKKLKGLDAITGSANFDICEYMLLSLVNVFAHTNTTIAMLCKTSVARNVFQELKRKDIPLEFAKLLTFNGKDVFNIAADCGLLVIQLSVEDKHVDTCDVYELNSPDVVMHSFGFKQGNFFAKIDEQAPDFSGKSCLQWRQGVKHDCSKVMELKRTNGGLFNGLHEQIDIEPDYVYPLVKSSSVKQYIIDSSDKYVIVTQHKIGDDTKVIKRSAPKTWEYLTGHQEAFTKRKSVIYKKAPIFGMFGIGDYSFSKYKVGISGFYKNPRFALISADKPIMMDDTCYFLSFNGFEQAYVMMLLLNSDPVQQFIKSISFIDSKRPYTKKVLDRIDFRKCLQAISYAKLLQTEKELDLSAQLNETMYNDVSMNLSSTDNQMQLF
jgi:methylase of polypeptide subunit release factors